MSVLTKDTEIHVTTPDIPKKAPNSSPDQANTPHAEDCTIYDYFKAHPSFAVGAASAFVTILTCIAQLLAYISNKCTLEYWEFNFSYATLGSDSVLYSAIATIMYALVLTVTIFWYVKIYEAYNEQISPLLVVKYLLKKDKNIKKRKCAASDSTDSLSSAENIKPQITESFALVIDQKTKGSLFRTLRRKTSNFIAYLFLILFFLVLASMVMILFVESSTSLWTDALIYSISHVILFALIYVSDSKASIGKGKIKEKATSINASALLDQINSQTMHSSEKISLKNIRIKNSTFIIPLILCVVICLILIVVFPICVNYNEAGKTTFEIVSLDGQTYAVVYHNKDSLFLEKADISDDTITIHTDQQRIIGNSDISFCVYTFQNVTKAKGPLMTHQPTAPSNGFTSAYS